MAVYDENIESPSRLDPNKVLMREKEVALDHGEEAAFRRENYEIFRKNLAKAFKEYDKDKSNFLGRDEFKRFMIDQAKKTGQTYKEETIDEIFNDMDVNRSGGIDKDEFINGQFKAFKNAEDNIEFLAEDIKGFN